MSVATENKPRPKLAAVLLAFTWQAGANKEPLSPAPYKYGGWTPAGWDCSGAVAYVLAGLGLRSLPDVPETWYAKQPYHPGPADVYKTWDKTFTPESIMEGDFLVWDTHIGIALSPMMMVSALSPEYNTFVSPIKGWGPSGQTMVVRRLLWSEYAHTN